MKQDSTTAYCLWDAVRPGAFSTMRSLAGLVSRGSQLYLVGGAMRNTMYFDVHGVGLPQRDYDLLYIGHDKESFDHNLLDAGFQTGAIQRPSQRSFEKPCITEPKNMDDYIVLDIGYWREGNIEQLLAEKINFSINGWAIGIQDLIKQDWRDHVIALPHAYEDIARKKLRLNPRQSPAIAYSNLFAAIRFMSQGFARPSEQEIHDMRMALRDFPEEKFSPNVKKLISYVGSEAKARELISQLGIEEDILYYENI